MKNEFNFTICVRCGKRTKPEVIVSYIGNGVETMRIGSQVFTKDYLAEWIEGTVLTAVKKGDVKVFQNKTEFFDDLGI